MRGTVRVIYFLTRTFKRGSRYQLPQNCDHQLFTQAELIQKLPNSSAHLSETVLFQ